MDPSEIKKKIVCFRILIIGRANAGKTTILQRVCNTKENPDIFNGAGEKVDAAVLTASRERGEHDIENEMVFRNNPGFIFHDSRGFEAGGESEYDKMNTFIADRSKKEKIKDRIHTIWYCIPMDQKSRCFTEAELKFFSRCDTGSIPVIVIFTKFDALYATEFTRLTENGTSRKDAKQLAPKHAEETFENSSQLKFLYNSKDIRRPPKCHVCLPDMHKDDANCGPLIKRTAETLDDEVLQQLFVSTQQTNLELCMKYAVEKTLAELIAPDEISLPEDVIAKLGCWFPHIWVVCLLILLRTRAMLIDVVAHSSQYDYDLLDRDGYLRDRDGYGLRLGLRLLLAGNLGIRYGKIDNLLADQRAHMKSRILSVTSGLSPLETIVQLGSAAVIIFEHSFYIFDKQRHLQDQNNSVPSHVEALERYMASPHATAVRDAVTAAVHANQGNSSNRKVKLFGRFWRKVKESFESSQEMAKQPMHYSGLIETILAITLEHRLPRP